MGHNGRTAVREPTKNLASMGHSGRTAVRCNRTLRSRRGPRSGVPKLPARPRCSMHACRACYMPPHAKAFFLQPRKACSAASAASARRSAPPSSSEPLPISKGAVATAETLSDSMFTCTTKLSRIMPTSSGIAALRTCALQFHMPHAACRNQAEQNHADLIWHAAAS